MPKANPTVFVVTLNLADTNEELVGMMRTMKSVRESGFDHIICTVSGLNDDPRELWQMPEVRAYCRRLMTLGFVSYLDVFAALNPDPKTSPMVRYGFGAGELWLIAEGYDLSQPRIVLEEATIRRLEAVLRQANKISDDTIGQFNSKR